MQPWYWTEIERLNERLDNIDAKLERIEQLILASHPDICPHLELEIFTSERNRLDRRCKLCKSTRV